MIKKFRKKLPLMYYTVITMILGFLTFIGLKIYFDYVNDKANEIQEKTDADYISKNITLQNNGLYMVNLKQDLEKYIIGKEIKNITYKIQDEKFYFEVGISINPETGEKIYEIKKIVDEIHAINAKMNLKNIEKIEYRTGNINEATVLNLITAFDSQYFAISDNNYYFLGEDIESISFLDNHFYYVSYNKNYRSLMEVVECTKDVKNSIDKFNEKDTFYNYGKINFFDDYYQKLSSKKYTVKNYCDNLILDSTEE